MAFLGAPYPIVKHPRGFLRTQEGMDQIKSDLLVLLLTNPRERVMLADFGTPLNRLVFEPNDAGTLVQVKDLIANSIRNWEPRIAVQDIEVSNNVDTIENSLDLDDLKQDIEHILIIKIMFTDFDNIQEVQELRLEVPLAGG